MDEKFFAYLIIALGVFCLTITILIIRSIIRQKREEQLLTEVEPTFSVDPLGIGPEEETEENHNEELRKRKFLSWFQRWTGFGLVRQHKFWTIFTLFWITIIIISILYEGGVIR